MSDKKVQTRERILAAATAALIQRGPADPSVGEVMGAAGLTVGGFYAHFESKDALMLEAFRQLLGRRRSLLKQLDEDLSPLERRALVAAFYLSRKHRDSQDDGCPAWQVDSVQQPPAALLAQERKGDGRGGQQKAHQHRVECDDAEIGRPAADSRQA